MFAVPNIRVRSLLWSPLQAACLFEERMLNDQTQNESGQTVYALWFVRERSEADDIELLIGIYETEADAKIASERLKTKPGFVDFPEGFQIHPYPVGRTGCEEGYVQTDSPQTHAPLEAPFSLFPSSSLFAASRIPFKNPGASADENFFASSNASSITTFTGAVPDRSS